MRWTAISLILAYSVSARAESLAAVCAEPTGTDSAYTETFRATASKYADISIRRASPEGYLSELDALLGRMGFSELLGCRETVPFELEIDNGETGMQVVPAYTANGELSRVVLNFDLSKPVEVALFSYAHELRHVCQMGDSRELVRAYYAKWAALTPREKYYYSDREDSRTRGIRNLEFESLDASVKIDRLVGEVEAFRGMYLTFRDAAARGVKELCARKAYRQYEIMESDWLAGQFAQIIIGSYVDLKDLDPAVFVLDAPAKTYFDESLGVNIEMPRFQSEVLVKLQALGVPYREPADSPKP